jgi:hypothetical protein
VKKTWTVDTECSIINPKNLENYKLIASYSTRKCPCFKCENEKRMKKNEWYVNEGTQA